MRNYYLNHYYTSYIYNDLAKCKIFYVGSNNTWDYINDFFIYKNISVSSLGIDISELNEYSITVFTTNCLNSWIYTDYIPMGEFNKTNNVINLAINKCNGGFNPNDTYNYIVQYMIVGWKKI